MRIKSKGPPGHPAGLCVDRVLRSADYFILAGVRLTGLPTFAVTGL
jgi:hypothetical protein